MPVAFPAPHTRRRVSRVEIMLSLAVLFIFLVITAERPAHAMKIQDVTSPGGIKAWLVEEHAVPLVAIRFAFDGGNAQDPAGKEGLANYLSVMLDEGAGDLDAQQFQERMEEIAMRMSFEDARDGFYGSFETLTVHRDAAAALLKMALTKPRFDADAVERMRKQLLASRSFAEKDPDRVAGEAWSKAAFPNHVYGRPAQGTLDSLAAIAPDDLKRFWQRTFARDTLKVTAVGDITAVELGKLLDEVFGALPAKAELTPVAAIAPAATGGVNVIEMDVPQSVAVFGLEGVARKDSDFMAAFVLNHILGGGGFASQLMEEVREKRGLAYSVYSYLQTYRHAAIFAGGVATKNEKIGESLDVIRSVLTKMATDGPTPEQLANAQSYLTGSYALRFDTSSKIASQLLGIQVEEFGIDYVDTRNGLIDAVTLDDIKRVAKRLLRTDSLLVTVVGKPKDLRG